MKKAMAVAVLVLVAGMLTGCATMAQFGIGEDAVADGVELFLKKQNLEGLVTKDQTNRFIALVKADAKMQELSSEVQANIAANVALQDRIAELGARYISGGQFVDPAGTETNSAAQ